MEQENNIVAKIFVTISFVMSQNITWKLILKLVSESTWLYKVYLAYQIMFALLYTLSCIFLLKIMKNLFRFGIITRICIKDLIGY